MASVADVHANNPGDNDELLHLSLPSGIDYSVLGNASVGENVNLIKFAETVRTLKFSCNFRTPNSCPLKGFCLRKKNVLLEGGITWLGNILGALLISKGDIGPT